MPKYSADRHSNCERRFAQKLVVEAVFLALMSGWLFADSAQTDRLTGRQFVVAKAEKESRIPPYAVKLVHSPNIRELHFLRQGTLLASVSDSIRIWNCKTGELVHALETANRFQSAVENGESLVTIDDPQTVSEHGWYHSVPERLPLVRVWDLGTGKQTQSVKIQVPTNSEHLYLSALASSESTHAVFCLVHLRSLKSPDSKGLFELVSDNSCRLIGWRIPEMTLLCDFEVDGDPRSLVVRDYSDTVLAYNHSDVLALSITKQKQLWKTKLCTLGADDQEYLERVFRYSVDPVNPAKEMILATTHNGKLGTTPCFNIAPGSGEASPHPISDRASSCIREKLLVMSRNELTGWAHRHFTSSWRDFELASELRKFDVDAEDSKAFATSDATLKSRVDCSSNPGEHLGVPGPNVMAWSEQANLIALTIQGDEAIHLFDTVTQRRSQIPAGTVTSIMRNSAKGLAVAYDSEQVMVTDFHATKSQGIRPIKDKISGIALSADEKICAIGIKGRIEFWDCSSQKRIAQIACSYEYLGALAFTDDDRSLIAIDIQGKVWKLARTDEQSWADVTAKKLTIIPEMGKDSLWPTDFERERLLPLKMIATAENGTTAAFFRPSRGWHVDDRNEHLSVHGDPGRSIVGRCWSEFDNRYQVDEASPHTGVVAGIDLGSQKWNRITPAVKHDLQMSGIRMTQDGRYLSLIFETGQVIVVDQKSRLLFAHVHTERKEIAATELLSSGKYLLVACANGLLQLWDTDDNELLCTERVPDCRVTDIKAIMTDDRIDIAIATRNCGLVHRQFIRTK